MRRILLISSLVLLWSIQSFGQNSVFPFSATLTTAEGEQVDSTIFDHDGPIIIDFWATFCKPCIIKYNTLKDQYQEWSKRTGVKIISISIDQGSRMELANKYKEAFDWPYETYFDPEYALIEKLNNGSKAVPLTLIYDKDRNLVHKSSGVTVLYDGSTKKGIKHLYSGKKAITDFTVDLSKYYKVVDEITSEKEKTFN